MGIVYHLIFFTAINKAAYGFGIVFILQGLLFLFHSLSNKIEFKYIKGIRSYTSLILIFYALIIYPLLGYAAGHGYPYSPTFDLPCPTTIFTFALLLFIIGKIPVNLTIIPLIWSGIGFTAVLSLGIYEDIGLLAAGIITLVFLVRKKIHKLNRMRSFASAKAEAQD